MDDVRLIWMKEVIYRFLVLDVTSQAFEDLLKRDTGNPDIFQKFLSNSDDSPRCLFFYSDIVEEEIEKDDPVELPVEKEKAETSFSSGSIKSESDAASESIIADADDASKGSETDEDDAQKELAEHAEKSTGVDKLSRTSLVLIVKKTELYVIESITEYVSSRSYAYFLHRDRNRTVPRMKNMYEARKVLPGHFDVGRIGQHPLVCIDKMVSCLYLPLLENETTEPQLSEKHYPIDKKKISSLMSGLTREMRDFTESTKHVLEQLDRPSPSPLPTFLDQPFEDLEEACKDSEFVAEAHDVARQWTDIAGQWAELCEEVSEQKPPENGLTNEIDFWKKQKLRLSSCLDQLSHTTIQDTFEVFDKIGCDISELKSITHQVEMELNKVTENVNYLSLLEKNAKNLLPGSPVQEAKKSLYDIFTVLKVIWVQSEHFKEPENLGRVLRGLTTLLKNRVVTDARNDMLFRKPLVEVRNIVDNSIEILEYWKKLYFSECETVKKYGGPYWWRFDVRMLFAETDYIITVCGDLRKVTKVSY
ncbi:hypothetical protein JTE90_023277 [Oedothorax gibbosus]|uniref:Dynein heavy chain tail domain-containing protein n=1 Tax=Oedothorax gibbosus TaxID=931172 RepID=A0AAV6UN02_9ARAC|nr:hypothetical protein JTE90_023277 [Oedothorax gibbosus]